MSNVCARSVYWKPNWTHVLRYANTELARVAFSCATVRELKQSHSLTNPTFLYPSARVHHHAVQAPLSSPNISPLWTTNLTDRFHLNDESRTNTLINTLNQTSVQSDLWDIDPLGQQQKGVLMRGNNETTPQVSQVENTCSEYAVQINMLAKANHRC